MEKDDRIIGKIKALLAKTIDNGASQAEMESALAVAQKLMLQHFISEHDIKDDFVAEKCVLKTIDVVKSSYDFDIFIFPLAQLFDCKSYSNRLTIKFFGFENDTEMCAYFYQLITRTCLNEIKLYKKSSEYKRLSRNCHGRTLVSSFVKGFLFRVGDKMMEMYKNRESSIPASYGLMVIEKKKKVEDEFEEFTSTISFKKRKPKKIEAEECAFNSGAESGNNVALVQGIEQKRDSFTLQLC